MRGKRNFHILKQPSVIIIPMIDIMLFTSILYDKHNLYGTSQYYADYSSFCSEC